MRLLVLAVVLAVAAARPQNDAEVAIVSMDSTQDKDGSFQYGYKTSDGTSVKVAGQSKQIGEEVGTVMQGSYSYVGDDGVTYTVTWVADENGFRAEGAHLPVAPTV